MRVSPLSSVRDLFRPGVYYACKNGRICMYLMGKTKEKKQMKARFRGREFTSVISSTTNLSSHTGVDTYRGRRRGNFTNMLAFLQAQNAHGISLKMEPKTSLKSHAQCFILQVGSIYLCL